MATANFIPQKNTWRLTLTFDCINQAKEIVIYLLGAGKADIVAQVLNGRLRPRHLSDPKSGNPGKQSALYFRHRSGLENKMRLAIGKN